MPVAVSRYTKYSVENINLFFFCFSSYKAKCHVAFTDFQNPSWIDGELAIFSRDVVGVLYREIEAMVVLQRTDEPYLQVKCANKPTSS